jgi:hypothetical protein
MKATIGIDIGGVIVSNANADADTSFYTDNYLETPEIDGASDAVRELVAAGHTVHLVSKCGAAIQKKSRSWLEKRGFYEKTGVQPESLHFCIQRADKASIAKRLGIQYFVDDRLEVLSHLDTVPYKYLFSPQAEEVAAFGAFLPQVKIAYSWDELSKALRADLSPQRAN